jgi:hypothetical protein
MKSTEETKNVITASIAGASMGLLFAYGFEVGIGIGIVVGALFGAAIGFRISRRPPKMRYPLVLLRRMLMAATFFLLTSFGYSYLLDQDLSQSQQLWAALLPLLGWATLVVSLGMAIASLDELQRRIQTEAIAIGFAGTAIFVGGYALFQFAGLGEVNVGLVLLVMSLMWLLGKLWTMWRYR